MNTYSDVAVSFQVPEPALAILEVIATSGGEFFIEVDKAESMVTISAILCDDGVLLGSDFYENGYYLH
ncbi:MAG: hypothetical protein MJ194_03440 [Clostridia bacterium]|nr:hypothetical protein [Clostridia bacterium]